jgi:hypothetical protein
MNRNHITPAAVLTIFLFLSPLTLLQAQSPAHGGSLQGEAIASTNSTKPADVQTNFNLAALVHTNAVGEYVMGLDILSSYPMQLPDNLVNNTNQAAWADAQVNAMIPASIKAFDGKKVRIEGYMLPTTLEKGKVTDFLLVASQISCCYGGPTQVHEFITVRVKGTAVKPNMDATIPVGGILRIGAIRENGQLVGVYRMEAENLVVPPPY